LRSSSEGRGEEGISNGIFLKEEEEKERESERQLEVKGGGRRG
jgi:hypothetical protein